MREVITASPRCFFIVIDFSALELRTLAAWCEYKFGFSKLGEIIRSGIDVHKYTAAQIASVSPEKFETLPNKKLLRQQAKMVSFGLPGGLGVDSFVEYAARPPYELTITKEQAIQFKQQWLQMYPEMRLHMQQQGHGSFETAVTPTGRIRSQIGYCSARNYPFQGLAGDGCKLAMWELLKAGYDVQGFVHDEFIIQVGSLMACKQTAEDIDRICCESMAKVCGTVPIECEYALTYRWLKDAEAVYDEHGELQVWKPEDWSDEGIGKTGS